MDDKKIYILQQLQEKGRVSVNDLSEALGCSKVTIRTKIRELADEGELIRVRGGAVSNSDSHSEESFKVKYNGAHLDQNVDEKKAIARAAYAHIESGDVILIDDSTTSFYLAVYIKKHPEKHIVVVTNSLPAANELSSTDHVELYMIGGYVDGYLAASMGDTAVESIKGFKIDKAFMGVHSINFDVGLTSIATPQMQIKQAILQAAKHVIVLADSSKFENGYLAVICPIGAVDWIITDDKISEKHLKRAEAEKVPLEIAETASPEA
ncbi:DeoR/GlpR family DNA-binding transcription regulator [Pseudoramibacter sp.]|uniref:DeoR/GlpR family DNA-binding transcription regulator n=1 Tax=Pseudoramibacter sp. TaxID=2034862 RepID=UPI0025F7F2A0|nr:DeoR/GlpR family DNA-binding transcription regulator [Pseudoramibacter sp.]MCH4072500.1 DeoR/GlpR family DNA-binding transcription regulator [Pseudoramibacter sp.]MCH4106271.1 DeoR/GlpR family DNA-binding transcription regulator [Pseudoramibacter sp.]